MQIIALQEYTDKYISLYQGEIRNIPDSIANKLITLGVAQKHGNEFLPNVSTADNGKVLSVTNGAWSTAEGSGSGGSENNNFIINCGEGVFNNEQSSNQLRLYNFPNTDKTWNELKTAINEEKNIIFKGSYHPFSDSPSMVVKFTINNDIQLIYYDNELSQIQYSRIVESGYSVSSSSQSSEINISFSKFYFTWDTYYNHLNPILRIYNIETPKIPIEE